MKIFIVDPLGSEGQAMYDWALCQNISDLGYDVTLISCPEYQYDSVKSSFKKALILTGYRNRKINKIIKIINYSISIFRLRSFIVKEKPQVVHFQFLLFPIIDYLLLRILKRYTTLVFTVHDVKVTTVSKTKALLLKSCYKIFHGLIIHSNIAKNILLKELNTVELKYLEVIEHGNYFPSLKNCKTLSREDIRRSYGIRGVENVILFIGSILPYKGLDIILKAFNILKSSRENIHLVVAGNIRNLSFKPYQKLIGKGENISLLIKYLKEDEIIDLLTVSDILVLPYRECYTPGVAHLGMSFGIPIMASNVGALPSVIIDKETGFLVEPNTPEEWAKQLSDIIENKLKLSEVSEKAKTLMREKHSWEVIAKKTVDFYAKNI